MPDASTVIARAIIEIGATGVKDANDEIRQLDTSLNTLESDYKKGLISLSEYASETAKYRARIADLTDGIEEAEAALKKYGSAQAALEALDEKATKGTKNLGGAFLELSRAFEDAQYGLRGVLNNIPGTIQMFGGPAGLAAGVSAAAVAFSIFQPYISQYLHDMGLFGEATSKASDEIEKLEEHIKALEEKPVKLTVDQFEIDQAREKLAQLKKDQAAFNALAEGKTVFEKEAGEQFKSNFEQMGGEGEQAKDAVKGAIAKHLLDQSVAIRTLAEVRARAEKAKQQATESAKTPEDFQRLPYLINFHEKQVEAAIKAAGDAQYAITKKGGEAERHTGNLFAGAFAGNDETARSKLTNWLRKAGQDQLANALQASTPEEMERQEDVDRAFDKKLESMKAGRASQAHKEKKRLAAAEKAGHAAEQSPEYKAEQAHLDRVFGRPGVNEYKSEEIAQANRRRTGPQKNEDRLDPFIPPEAAAKKERGIAEEHLAKQIYQGSGQATGVQFSPEQARAAAKATGDMVSKNVDFNTALQSALLEQIQAMSAMGNQLFQQQMMMGQIRQEFAMVRRGIQTRSRTAGKR